MRDALGKVVAKAHLPTKVCIACMRPFTWRKLWERSWDTRETCSQRCSGTARNARRAAGGANGSGAGSGRDGREHEQQRHLVDEVHRDRNLR